MEKDPSDYTVTQESVLKLIHEQKRMNREMIAELEQIHGPFPISHDIQYIKVFARQRQHAYCSRFNECK